MAQFLIPTVPTEPNYSIRVTLDGRDYFLDFEYNQRTDTWSFNLLTESGDLLRAGVKCVCNVFLLKKLVGPDRPPGELLIVDDSGNSEPPELGELGEDCRCVLYYLDAAELAELGAS